MYVCICNAVTDTEIREAAEAGVDNLYALQDQLGVAANCGSCSQDALAIVNEARAAQKPAKPAAIPQPILYNPASA